MNILIAGWFSYKQGNATAGDLLAVDVVGDWLDSMNHTYDIAVVSPFGGGTTLDEVDPNNYTHAIFICGPFGKQADTTEAFFERFRGCRTVGINLTMIEQLSDWSPFDVLIERDSSEHARPDLTFLSKKSLVPVVGVCLLELYGNPLENNARAAIQRLIDSRSMSVVQIDTRLDKKKNKFRNPAEVESIIARMDLVITTRLHGTVLALKNGVPTITIDQEGSKLKVKRQADAIGWPVVFKASEVTDEGLQSAFDYCLTKEAKTKALECSEFARENLEGAKDTFFNEFDVSQRSLPVKPKLTSAVDENVTACRISTNVQIELDNRKISGSTSEGDEKFSFYLMFAKNCARKTLPRHVRRLVKKIISPK